MRKKSAVVMAIALAAVLGCDGERVEQLERWAPGVDTWIEDAQSWYPYLRQHEDDFCRVVNILDVMDGVEIPEDILNRCMGDPPTDPRQPCKFGSC